jgi:hypothetical protein
MSFHMDNGGNPTTVLLQKIAHFLQQDVRSLASFVPVREELLEQVAIARRGLEERMMRLVAESRREPLLPVVLQMTRRDRPGGKSTYLDWREAALKRRSVDPRPTVQKLSQVQKNKFNELSVLMTQLTLHHSILNHFKTAVMQQNLPDLSVDEA